ncbi:hypothetical protein F5X68DRAFT_31015 [Plectosphaerella plurivora]|uniref:Uncharacterized protein n=1 Tax=Plectosphaerella plurivora TaxID=936078 RepID=A0A9P8VL88_9PEZI|nr:hypothetical protein F5X68DRAFT_31015 [Plectosphaerella plurivora]
MRGLPFVPARDSRHRHAAFALCRALLRQAARIPLPKDLRPAAGQPNPVQVLVLQQFRTNRGDTSPRLVLAALTAGYKFLSLFSKAPDPSSPSHIEVTEYLRRRLARENGRITTNLWRRKLKPPPIPNPPPLLIKTTGPDGLDTFERNIPPVPFEKLKDGKRHIPKLFVTSGHVPFLRMKKPQPYLLSKIIRDAAARTQRQMDIMKDLQTDEMRLAKDEDKWDMMMGDLAKEAGLTIEPNNPQPRPQPRAGRGRYREGDDNSYAGSTYTNLKHLYATMRTQRLNNIARAQALVRIIEEEKELAREEGPRRRALVDGKGIEGVGEQQTKPKPRRRVLGER